MKADGGQEMLDMQRSFPPRVAGLYESTDQRLNPRGPALGQGAGMHHGLASYWRFLVAGLVKHHQTGALLPSQRFLIHQMIAPIPANYRGHILELGAGTGALTQRLAARCPKARLLACEINPVLARDIETRLAMAGVGRKVHVISQPAQQMLAAIAQKELEQPDFILSGIPLGNLGKEDALALIQSIHLALAPGGIYIQFQHSLLDRKKIKATFAKMRTLPVLLNLPPAVVYYAQKSVH
ncbi:MAG TPA: methyltransferase domain-containing protein [Verrucomicrobiae bacterium]|nr:methyltransferase domain-containing protein [Verrucomicrobiae bacterium]